MQLWFAHESAVTLREQLATQVILGILSDDLRPGQRLPSTRELARRFRLHPNTVSAGFRQLDREQWVEFRRGSGVYVRDTKPEKALSPPFALEQLLGELLRSARRLGFPLAAVRSRLRHWFETAAARSFSVDRIRRAVTKHGMRVLARRAKMVLFDPASSFRSPARYNWDEMFVRKLIQLLGILFCTAVFVPLALAKKTERPLLPAKIMQANSVYVDCVCPRGLAVARDTALQQLQNWGRFQISQQHRQTDLVFLFSGNPYLGDYVTRDGPDDRPVKVDFTIMTVIDPKTGQTLWTDSRRWGSLRVRGATKDLIEELRQQMEEQVKRWSLNDILLCSVTPVYAGFAHLSPEEALAKSNSGTAKVSGTPEDLILTSLDAPAFCKRAEFLLNPERRIIGFKVFASRADDLDVGEVIQRADQFDFAGGKYSSSEQVYFNAQSKDRKILIQFNVDGHRSILSLVSYFY